MNGNKSKILRSGDGNIIKHNYHRGFLPNISVQFVALLVIFVAIIVAKGWIIYEQNQLDNAIQRVESTR